MHLPLVSIASIFALAVVIYFDSSLSRSIQNAATITVSPGMKRAEPEINRGGWLASAPRLSRRSLTYLRLFGGSKLNEFKGTLAAFRVCLPELHNGFRCG